MAIVRRFIAGARCPQCGAEDSIALNVQADHEWINCVHCDYHEDRPQAVIPATPATLATEVRVQRIELE